MVRTASAARVCRILCIAATAMPGCRLGAPKPTDGQTATNTSRPQFWPPDNVPTAGLARVSPPDGGEEQTPEPHVGDAWVTYCEWRFRDALMILGMWGHPELSSGVLAKGKSRDGTTVIGYHLAVSASEWYLAEVAGPRPIPSREWVSTFGNVKRAGPAGLFGEHDGHAARITASGADPFKREAFFSALMPEIKYCVGDERGIMHFRLEAPPPQSSLADAGAPAEREMPEPN